MKRIITLAIALVAVLALPSSALAGKSHLLKLYKVEKQIDVQGQDETYKVSCNGGDLALDGMYRVDNVDQDNGYSYDGPGGTWSTNSNDPFDHADWDVDRSVRPVVVGAFDPDNADAHSDSTYYFQFLPMSGGDVQLKIWVTCLGKKSETIGGHSVTWDITDPGSGTITSTNATPKSALATDPDCGSKLVVQPSYRVTSGDADLVASYPFFASSKNQWKWTWANQINPFTVDHRWRCLDLKSNAASDGSGHKHRVVKMSANQPSPAIDIKKSGVSETQAICGEHYKGLIGGWDYSGTYQTNPSNKYWYERIFFLGMDPRIKARAYKFINNWSSDVTPGYGVGSGVRLFLTCFKDKTT